MATTRTIEETITRIEIKWELDDDMSLADMLGDGPQLNSDGRLDVEATIDYWIRDLVEWVKTPDYASETERKAKYRNPDGTPNMAAISEEARLYTAQERERVRTWLNDDWTSVSCVVRAYTNTGQKFLASIGGINSDCGKEYKKEIETEQLNELGELETEFLITREEFDALPCEESKDSWGIDESRSSDCVPIPALPEAPEGYTATYVYDNSYYCDDALRVVLTCDECDADFVLIEHWGNRVTTLPDEHKDGTKHDRYCFYKEFKRD